MIEGRRSRVYGDSISGEVDLSLEVPRSGSSLYTAGRGRGGGGVDGEDDTNGCTKGFSIGVEKTELYHTKIRGKKLFFYQKKGGKKVFGL